MNSACITTASLLLLTLASSMPAATRTWDGGDASSNWTAQNNWNGNTPVTAGDTLIFPAGLAAGDKTVNHNFPAGTTWSGVALNDSGYTLSGNTLRLTGNLTAAYTGNSTVNAGLNLEASIQVGGGGSLTLGAGSMVALNTAAWTQFHCSHPESRLIVNGGITGNSLGAHLDLKGPGKFEFNGVSTFTAPFSLQEDAELTVTHSQALGVTALENWRTIEGTLRLNSAVPLTLNNRLMLTGGTSKLVSGGGHHTITGEIGFQSYAPYETASRIIDIPSGSLSLNCRAGMDGYLNDNGSIVKTGAGVLNMGGNVPNGSLAEFILITQGQLRLMKPAGMNNIAGIPGSMIMLQAGDSSGNVQDAEIMLEGDEQIDDSTVKVAVYSDGSLNLNAHQETVRWLYMEAPGRVITGSGRLSISENVSVTRAPGQLPAVITGNVELASPMVTWNVEGAAFLDWRGVQVNGSISAAQPGTVLHKSGDATLECDGFVTVECITVADGVLQMDSGSSTTEVEVAGGVLCGSGSVGDTVIRSGGIIQGGALPATPDSLTVYGSLTMDPGSGMILTINGTQPGQYSSLYVLGGPVNIKSATLGRILQADLPPAPPGTELMLLNNGSAQPVVGVFAGMPEGYIWNMGPGADFALSYKGGDGNDITLTALIAPTGVTKTWDGGGADNNWTTAANWDNNTAPVPGDALVFPAVAARKTNVNNFPAGTTFHSITLNAGNYSISGNQIRVNTELRSTHGTGGQTIQWSTPLIFTLSGTIAAASGAMEISGSITLDDKPLALEKAAGPGALTLSGSITGHTIGLRKMGPGRVVLDGQPKTYTGETQILEGIVELRRDDQLGAYDPGMNETELSDGVTLIINGAAPFVLMEPLYGAAGTETWNLQVAAPAGAVMGNEIFANGMNLHCAVPCRTAGRVQAIHLAKTGPGAYTLESTPVPSFVQNFRALEGQTILRVPSAAFNLSIGDSLTPATPARVDYDAATASTFSITLAHAQARCEFGSAQAAAYDVQFLSGGTLSGSNTARLTVLHSITAHPSASTAHLDIATEAGSSMGVPAFISAADGSTSPDIEFLAPVYGAMLHCNGPGSVHFMADNPPTGLGVLQINSGSAFVFANWSPTAAALNGGLLGGHGTLGNIEPLAGGTVSPGASPGILGSYKAFWNPSLTLRIELNGLNMGSDYDQFFAYNAPDLGGAQLELTAGFDPAPGDSFMLVRNVSGDPITGTFAGAPEGGYVQAPGGKVFQITYAGGDGDDVVITRVEKEAPQVVEWQLLPPVNPGDSPMNHFIFKGVPGLTYMLECSADLEKWDEVKSTAADIPGGLMVMDLEAPEGDPRKFYRLTLP